MINQAKRSSYKHECKYKYGYEVPREYDDALRLDDIDGNTKWQDAIILEMEKFDDSETFTDRGHMNQASSPAGYKKILRVHLDSGVNHLGSQKARLVAGVHLTDIHDKSVYSSVFSIRGLYFLTYSQNSMIYLFGQPFENKMFSFITLPPMVQVSPH